jgi:hypothetical protein
LKKIFHRKKDSFDISTGYKNFSIFIAFGKDFALTITSKSYKLFPPKEKANLKQVGFFIS